MFSAVIRPVCVLAVLVVVALAGGWWVGRRSRDASSSTTWRDTVSRASGDRRGKRETVSRPAEDSEDARRIELAERLRSSDPRAGLQELRHISPDSTAWLRAARLAAVDNLQLGRDYDALAPLKALAAAFPDDAGVHQAISEVAFRAGDYRQALGEAQTARRLAPASTEICLLIADCLDNLDRSAEMVEPLLQALQLDPALLPAHLNLAYSLEKSGRPDDALPHAERFLAERPESVQGNKVLALVRRRQGRPEEALTAIQRSRRKDSSNVVLAILQAEILLDLTRPGDAFELLAPFDAGWGYEPRFARVFARVARSAGRAEAESLERRLVDVRTTASTSSAEPDVVP